MAYLEAKLTEEKIAAAIGSFSNKQFVGTDGFPMDWYKNGVEFLASNLQLQLHFKGCHFT